VVTCPINGAIPSPTPAARSSAPPTPPGAPHPPPRHCDTPVALTATACNEAFPNCGTPPPLAFDLYRPGTHPHHLHARRGHPLGLVAGRAAAVDRVTRSSSSWPTRYNWGKTTSWFVHNSNTSACSLSAASPVAPPPSTALPRPSHAVNRVHFELNSHLYCLLLVHVSVHLRYPIVRRAAAVNGVARGGGASPTKYIWAKNTSSFTLYSNMYACTPSAASSVAPPPSTALPRAAARHRPPTILASRPRRVFIATTCTHAPSSSSRSSCRRGARRYARRRRVADKIQPGKDHLIVYFIRHHASVHPVRCVAHCAVAVNGAYQASPAWSVKYNSG